jgi:hypothetical protein
LELRDTVQSMLASSINDPIAKIMAENSHLTKTQLETLLIDILSDNISDKSLKYDEKARLRLTKAKISRGAFNRTLKQAKENVTKSIYTVILLGYLGVFETTTLDPYPEVANQLHAYLGAYKNAISKDTSISDRLKIIGVLRQQLETSLQELSNRSTRRM